MFILLFITINVLCLLFSVTLAFIFSYVCVGQNIKCYEKYLTYDRLTSITVSQIRGLLKIKAYA